jgi:hypothetical protein
MKFNPGQSIIITILTRKILLGMYELIRFLKSYNEVSFISMNKYYDLIDKSSKDLIDVKRYSRM